MHAMTHTAGTVYSTEKTPIRTISFSSLVMFAEVVTALVGVLGLSCTKEGAVAELLDTARERPAGKRDAAFIRVKDNSCHSLNLFSRGLSRDTRRKNNKKSEIPIE